MSIRAGDGLRFIDVAASTTSMKLLGADKAKALEAIGITSLNDLLNHRAVASARLLVANARSGGGADLSKALAEAYRTKTQREAPAWPVEAINGIGTKERASLAGVGVATVMDLAQLAQEAEKLVLAGLEEDDVFFERPSAPRELIPTILGQEASSVRFASFVKDTDLENLKLKVDALSAVQLPISGRMTGNGTRNSVDGLIERLRADIAKKGLPAVLKELGNATDEEKLFKALKVSVSGRDRSTGSLISIFENLSRPVIGLGYIAGHRQNWINLGTNLGEVVHSISLAPGESRNIAQVNWYRRQALSRSEATTESEQLTSNFVQNRAIEEITSAVAREHQSGGSATEASTSATAFSIVGSIAVGAGVGAAIGSVVPGVGTAIGAAIGAGVSGAAAAGFTASNSHALGTIQTDTSGDRSIVAENQQRIQLSTSQISSTVRSLWSTIVLEDVQAETVNATTSNITNYNHMHALNMQYYEVLQRYLVKIELDKVQPILLLPFTFLDLTNFDFVRDYWDAVRDYIDDEGLRDQGDAYFVTEDVPTAPDLVPVPPAPEPPAGRVRNLKVRLELNYDKPITLGLSVKLAGRRIEGQEVTDRIRNGNSENPGFKDWIFEFPVLRTYDELTFQVDVDRATGGRIAIDLAILEALITGENSSFDISMEEVGSIMVPDSVRRQTFSKTWDMPDVSTRDDRRYSLERAKRARALATNEARQAAFDALQANTDRFRERLERYVLRRRYFFTRVILNCLEPEELIRLIETVSFADSPEGRTPTIPGTLPVTAIADTAPVGFVNGAFILRLKTIRDKNAAAMLARYGFGSKPPADIVKLAGYAAETIAHFEEEKKAGSVVSTDHVYVPTGGLFGEAVLGRSNGAEYLDQERFFHWHEAPIPNAAPTIADISTDSRFQSRDVTVTSPEGNLTIVSPQGMPDPTGMSGVLSAIQNGNLFRDMSNAGQLAAVVGGLADLSGKVAAAASTMTGDAAKQAMQLSSDLAKAALGAAIPQRSETSKGAELAQAARIDREDRKEEAKASIEPTPPATTGTPTPPTFTPTPKAKAPTVQKQIVLKNAGLTPAPAPAATGSILTNAKCFLILNGKRGTTLDNAFDLLVYKNGIAIADSTMVAGTALSIPLRFENHIAQFDLDNVDVDSPLIMGLSGNVNTFGADLFVSHSNSFMIPNGLQTYVFKVTMKTETIDVKASSKAEAKAGLTGEINLGIGWDDDDTPAAGTTAPKKPKAKKPFSLKPNVLAILKEFIPDGLDVTAEFKAQLSGGASASGSISAEGVFRFEIPNGELDIAFDAATSR